MSKHDGRDTPKWHLVCGSMMLLAVINGCGADETGTISTPKPSATPAATDASPAPAAGAKSKAPKVRNNIPEARKGVLE